MKTHQAVWCQEDPAKVYFRHLTCLQCKVRMCTHFSIGSWSGVPTKEKESSLQGQWVAVIYDNNWYPGIVENENTGILEISFMDRSGSKFYWPIKVDRQKVLRSDILCIMPTPPVPVSSRLFVVENNANIDKLFKEQ